MKTVTFQADYQVEFAEEPDEFTGGFQVSHTFVREWFVAMGFCRTVEQFNFLVLKKIFRDEVIAGFKYCFIVKQIEIRLCSP